MNISAILTAHSEGLLAGPSLASFFEAIGVARDSGLGVETIVILDRPDELTRSMVQAIDPRPDRIVVTDYGDPALARNRGIAEAGGHFAAFLDADDLWSFNWLTSAFAFISGSAKQVVAHSELNVYFGGSCPFLWIHADSEAPHFDPGYLGVSNPWTALTFAPRELHQAYPFRANDLAAGYGIEDWQWNRVTLLAGCAHRPVPGTVHFIRQRADSQNARCLRADVVPWPTDSVRYEVADQLRDATNAARTTGSREGRS